MSPDLYRLEQKLSIGVSLEEVAFFFFTTLQDITCGPRRLQADVPGGPNTVNSNLQVGER